MEGEKKASRRNRRQFRIMDHQIWVYSNPQNRSVYLLNVSSSVSVLEGAYEATLWTIYFCHPLLDIKSSSGTFSHDPTLSSLVLLPICHRSSYVARRKSPLIKYRFTIRGSKGGKSSSCDGFSYLSELTVSQEEWEKPKKKKSKEKSAT